MRLLLLLLLLLPAGGWFTAEQICVASCKVVMQHTPQSSAAFVAAVCCNALACLPACLQVVGSLLSSFVRRPAHSRGMWLSGVSNNLLAFTYLKAVINTLL
jgi:hypothetical protein